MQERVYTIEVRRRVHRNGEERLRQAYARLNQWAIEQPTEEALVLRKEEADATSRDLCPSLDPESGKRSDD
ncbi:MAG: hypothetical protein KDK05_21605 [Candidatus Competibacteraceae bacterium]|nr:hypothetical protein [Candidatus Competibacteraceae bacterium]